MYLLDYSRGFCSPMSRKIHSFLSRPLLIEPISPKSKQKSWVPKTKRFVVVNYSLVDTFTVAIYISYIYIYNRKYT